MRWFLFLVACAVVTMVATGQTPQALAHKLNRISEEHTRFDTGDDWG